LHKLILMEAQKLSEVPSRLLHPREGYGPLLQRDYWAIIREAKLGPSQIAELVMNRFWHFAPEELAAFRRIDGKQSALCAGDVLEVRIHLAGTFHVRVLHNNLNSVTLRTLEGHPECGRITFGAYRNDYGDVVFHIRSRARTSSGRNYAGFIAIGEAMQTNTWTEFVNRVALAAGKGVIGYIHAESQEIRDEPEEALDGPTFIAEGD
jgi:hypothetical protein